ncbi:DUF2617 family protein [Halorhabdus amylolytica]|uniref:DUF2617 family protein n=1 Tax=Halorhabdus amylolytica TaxID=2559573 RepID=UPI0010AA4628|nr:DUF2617 family protein [Halorhabdus amylolytica]
MTRSTLQFVHSTEPPSIDLQVFDSLTTRVLGTSFTFRVIGSSHYISAPAYDFHELVSCEQLSGDAGERIALDGPQQDSDGHSSTAISLEYETERVRCETKIERRPLATFPADATFDLAYWFEEDAATTVTIGATGYETYHTYPEFDLALYTRTSFEPVPNPDPTDREPNERQPMGHPTD